ncbi:C2 calcium-dependent domain-containing protein 4A [Pipistrellus kuhlii]|uniref:C2 calcium dependent domain containing 4A n=1 Tax=Pipistrellus kuhlii TaxID=59472 RepID=A0A7J8AYQ2_PIPKU|nr:C2 calcium-dependent domain-containing protein 4A [Pipistrellus kuhlii]XP_036295960.1 C2 calcium-dependent domain-containing protein 4A [Pipistrellus kuhlii]KAF6391411.1 C2 calcium dependent domain containing 4A [Pipistrellus kuhlii]
MWCLERLGLGPERLLRGGSGRLQGWARRTAANAPAKCANVLTPDRIPDFCIPPRFAPCPVLAAHRDSRVKRAGDDEGAGRTDWDPRSQAALSLPHLPRARTAYGFCALLESPHTRRKESLFLGGPSAPAPLPPPALRPRAHTYGGGGGGGDAPLWACFTPPAAFGGSRPPRNTLAPRPRGLHPLRAPKGLLSRALQARRSHSLARARSVSSGDLDGERSSSSGSLARPRSASPPSDPGPRPECVEAEGTVALGRACGALRLAAEYNAASGRLRLRLLRPEGPAGGATEPCAAGCRVSLVLQPPGKARPQRSAVLRRSRKAGFDQDFCFDGLSEDEVRRLAVRVKAEAKGRGLKRGRLLGQGELLLGSLLLL